MDSSPQSHPGTLGVLGGGDQNEEKHSTQISGENLFYDIFSVQAYLLVCLKKQKKKGGSGPFLAPWELPIKAPHVHLMNDKEF